MTPGEKIMQNIQKNKARHDFVEYMSDIIVSGTLCDLAEARESLLESLEDNQFEYQDLDMILESLEYIDTKMIEIITGDKK